MSKWMKVLGMGAAFSCFGLAAEAAPNVVVSIKPIHSLVSAVMQGVGEPALIVKGGASPHSFALRPSDAQAIENADLVFWVGPGLETFLDGPLESLAGNANVVELSEANGIELLELREGVTFDEHDHDDEHADEEGHDDHDHEMDDDDEHDHEDADHDHEDEVHQDHLHDEGDPHLWLDPQNAIAIVNVVADALAEADAENAATYLANAEAEVALLEDLTAELTAELETVAGHPFVVFHDGYHYFEYRFGVEAAGSITVSPESAPGARRIAEIREKIAQLDAACVFSEPQFEPALVATVIEGTNARSGVLDPLGAELEDGPDLYPTLLRNMAASMKACLEQ